MSLLEKPSIYNQPSIYNGGGGGGGGGYDKDGFVLYSKLLFHGAYSFKQFGDNSLQLILVKDDDRLILNVSADLNLANKNEYHHILNFQKTGGGISGFKRCGVVCRATYYNYCINTTTFGTQINYITSPVDLSLDLRQTKVVINGANTTFSAPPVGDYICNSISAPFGENSFSSFSVFGSDKTLKEFWIPALNQTTSKKGILDIYSGRFIEAANQTYSELI